MSNKLILNKRLNAIVKMCEPCDILVDVGTDHGKVAISVANLKISNKVIAIDNKEGPLKQCIANKELYLNSDSSELITLLSDGIIDINKNDECGIIIAGMGYDLISEILNNIELYNFKYLIISPHTKVTELIKFLDSKGIYITDQRTVFEDNKYYFIFKAKKK